ncbi:MAG: DUF4105 domain-containing protein [Campylobacterota bacterium]|nr:DUF4105 domain-containing protein [Campylobacterota bacterium]
MYAQSLEKTYQHKAKELNLSESRYWKLLLHMNGVESEIDDASFFLSSEGKYNASSELNVTIALLLNETVFDNNATACRFPARKAWLQEQLEIDEFPQTNCHALNTLIKKVDPKSATLVFPSAHINSPASMFGHTFLRIDSSYDSKLLSHAINYAATADQDTENGVVFAVKGLFGGYSGVYSLLPYYEKLKEYRDTEQRDIWEYKLNLSEEEVRRMLLHVWELGNSFSWYYFFDENCSYNMLWLIEVARPTVHLREKFFYHVMPIDTVFALEEENLVSHKHFRPSKRQILLAYEKSLSPELLDSVTAVSRGELDVKIALDKNSSIQEKRYLLEASSELLEYLYIENRINSDEYKQRFHTVLNERSKLGRGEAIVVNEPHNPDQSHRANLITVQAALQEGEVGYMLGFRPAYHTLVDSDIGLLRGTQIEFLSLLLHYSKNKRLEIEDMTILSLSSIAQRSTFFKPFSWRTSFKFDRNYMSDELLFKASVGAGYSWGNEWSYFYALADLLSYVKSSSSMGVSASLGGVIYEAEQFKTNIELTQRLYIDGTTQSLVNISQLWSFDKNRALKLQYDYVQYMLGQKRTLKLVFDYFF